MEYRIPTTPLKHGDQIWVHLNLHKSRGDNPASWSITDRRGNKGSNPTFNKVIANVPEVWLRDATPRVRGTDSGSTIDTIRLKRRRRVTAWIEGAFIESTWLLPTLHRTVHFNPHRIKPWCYCFHYMSQGIPTSKFHGTKLCSFNTDKSFTVE